ncbi:hypothetical protein B0H11DRAFT_1898192 [Mycena galericulata]|nr:hypothetical protein B0H11DRAFT_1898192 [Mycena galericulata]
MDIDTNARENTTARSPGAGDLHRRPDVRVLPFPKSSSAFALQAVEQPSTVDVGLYKSDILALDAHNRKNWSRMPGGRAHVDYGREEGAPPPECVLVDFPDAGAGASIKTPTSPGAKSPRPSTHTSRPPRRGGAALVHTQPLRAPRAATAGADPDGICFPISLGLGSSYPCPSSTPPTSASSPKKPAGIAIEPVLFHNYSLKPSARITSEILMRVRHAARHQEFWFCGRKNILRVEWYLLNRYDTSSPLPACPSRTKLQLPVCATAHGADYTPDVYRGARRRLWGRESGAQSLPCWLPHLRLGPMQPFPSPLAALLHIETKMRDLRGANDPINWLVALRCTCAYNGLNDHYITKYTGPLTLGAPNGALEIQVRFSHVVGMSV